MKRLAVRLVRLGITSGLRKGWRDGVVGGNRAWVVIGGFAVVGHLAGRVLGREEEVIFRERLAAGETFRVSHLPRR